MESYKNGAYNYQQFFDSKTNKEFVFYDTYPRKEELEAYIIYISRYFPLHEYGTLNIKELAEIIKHIYQFRNNKEYSILTIGTTENNCFPEYGYKRIEIRPHLFFMIGNKMTLEPFMEFNGKFINSDKVYKDIYLKTKGMNLINIEADNDFRSMIDIECLTGNDTDRLGEINYFDENYKDYTSFFPSFNKQIFSTRMPASLRYSGGYKIKGIKDVFDFNIHPFDSYIAKILISIIIYKRNNNIKELSKDDYNHIFRPLFGEQVDIIKEAKKDIPRELIYVPNSKSKK